MTACMCGLLETEVGMVALYFDGTKRVNCIDTVGRALHAVDERPAEDCMVGHSICLNLYEHSAGRTLMKFKASDGVLLSAVCRGCLSVLSSSSH
jgi:hypothetical protein